MQVLLQQLSDLEKREEEDAEMCEKTMLYQKQSLDTMSKLLDDLESTFKYKLKAFSKPSAEQVFIITLQFTILPLE
jgi:hypothetical protein